jgi:hypothetical protein
MILPSVEFPKGSEASGDQIGRENTGLEADSLLRSEGRDEDQCIGIYECHGTYDQSHLDLKLLLTTFISNLHDWTLLAPTDIVRHKYGGIADADVTCDDDGSICRFERQSSDRS